MIPAVLILIATAVSAGAVEVRGTVVDALSRKPLSRAEVVLRPAEPGKQALGVTTGADGSFAFFDVSPGKYSLSSTRSGYLNASVPYQNSVRMSSPFDVGADVSGIVLRMLPAAAVSGKVRHFDGELAAGIIIEAYREYFRRGRHGYESVGRARTTDRGEYRIFGLPPGRYCVGAVVVPYGAAEDVEEQWTRDAHGRRVPPERTVTTYLPSAEKPSDATEFTLRAGAEFENADIFLTRARTVAINGVILHGGTGRPVSGPSIALLHNDYQSGRLLPSHANVRGLPGGGLDIRGIVPGSYILEVKAVEGRTLLYSRHSLSVGDAGQSDLRILARPETPVRGIVYAAERGQEVPPGLRVIAEPRHDSIPRRSAELRPDGSFSMPLIPDETYDISIVGTPRNVYLRSATLNNSDILTFGLRAPDSNAVPITLTVDERGSEVLGETRPGAVVSLIPAGGPKQRFAEAQANEWGLFRFAGIAPGEYTLLAWYDEPPCEIWDPVRSRECAKLGHHIVVDAGTSSTVSLGVDTGR